MTDLDGAAEYVTGLHSAAERQNASTALVSGWASKDAAVAKPRSAISAADIPQEAKTTSAGEIPESP